MDLKQLNNDKYSILIGSINFKSKIKIEELGNILSEELFSGLKFEGFNESIYEEIPAVYIKKPILNSKIILSGTNGFDEDNWYQLLIEPWELPNDYLTIKKNNINNYLLDLFKKKFKNYDFKIIYDEEQ